ncbi:hypothetical protein [Oscillibacter sp.]|uniref:hypothetical protein n=1 Tax=Oscillibacter sp. TaxID=1945593 RepID=UPI00289E6FAB|nr:hypothetical protein [Oscillibacter sp.]
MKQYEYKFVKFNFETGFNYDKKITDLETQWNALGEQGWKFCRDGNGFSVFIRERSAAEGF